MNYPSEFMVRAIYGKDWRILFLEAWDRQSRLRKIYYTLTRRHVHRVIRRVERNS